MEARVGSGNSAEKVPHRPFSHLQSRKLSSYNILLLQYSFVVQFTPASGELDDQHPLWPCGGSPSCRSPWLCHAPMLSLYTNGTILRSSHCRSPAMIDLNRCRNAVPKSLARHYTMWYVFPFPHPISVIPTYDTREGRMKITMQSCY